MLPSRCPGFLLLLFGNSPATRAIIGVKFAQFLPEPSSSARERTNCWVGKQKHRHLVRWISFYVMEIGLDARRFRLKLWGGSCYHTEEKSRMKRRRGCRGWRGSPILASRAQKITQKSLSDPQILRGVTHWLVVGT